MRLIVGLGNPGREYAGTRHNVGFEVVTLLSKRHGIPLSERGFRALYGRGVIEGEPVCLFLPMTYMNLSGEAVGAISRFYRIPPEDMIVILDDVNLPLGQIRLRAQGSSGGQKGLESILQHLGTEAVPRVRVGIGRPSDGDVVSYVLSRFKREEEPLVQEATMRAADAVEYVLKEGWNKAMSRFNRPQVTPETRS
ncbi:peptidyl-tRNA hydrolase [Chthonomonas calidirosea]|uniref:Peptidyl-tRNA hydrolase n=1 Tax=Chthonomonas calidirosea (strain DSM 23976 / ICMP 18418 / T49) TaxID=1303518 RepID=S0ESA1_CHTCT|nr:aminoacyl-tRNA hydrolase [Chthonomonas calidirosea]CCW33984.1 peptidyl-tRNA hydrolase [Chthonomonas calidirosea T49]CEK14974.1 peptidyl-tRNA hydrolase [Chthonomonas calidirosea]CEK16098.1 peptidyl-tRNA hydrolase [Chthonomonas calidirosea]